MKVWLYDNYDSSTRAFSNKGSALKAAIKDYCSNVIPNISVLHYADSAVSVAEQISGDMISLIDDNHIEDVCYLYELEVED